MDSQPIVGVIGIGAMGMNVAKRLLKSGFIVRVRDIRPEAEGEAAASGAIVCASPEALADGCSVVVTLVVDDAQTEEVVLGSLGAARAMAQETVLLMCSTVPPAFAESLGARLTAHGQLMLDAPVSGGPARALAGALSMMIAGPDLAVERAGPVLDAMTRERFRINARLGDGSKAKIVNNMLAGVNLAAACEAMALVARLGLDSKMMFDVICASSGASWMFADRIPRVLTEDYAPRAALDILRKDLSIVLRAAHGSGAAVPVAESAWRSYEAAAEQGLGALDDAALVKLYRNAKND